MTTEGVRKLPEVEPLGSMEEAWAERDRLRAERDRLWDEGDRLYAERDRLGDEGARLRAEGYHLCAEGSRLRAEGDLVVILTAQKLYGQYVIIDWVKRKVKL